MVYKGFPIQAEAHFRRSLYCPEVVTGLRYFFLPAKREGAEGESTIKGSPPRADHQAGAEPAEGGACGACERSPPRAERCPPLAGGRGNLSRA